MKETVLVGRNRKMQEVPWIKWKEKLSAYSEQGRQLLSFMSEEHHRVRDFLVLEIPRRRAPIAPSTISESLALTASRTGAILEELEKNLFFLVRNEAGSVEWAYPVTAAATGHRLTFSSGERIDAA